MLFASHEWARIRMVLALLLAASTMLLGAPPTTQADTWGGGGDGWESPDWGPPIGAPGDEGGDVFGCNLPGSVKGSGVLLNPAGLRIHLNVNVDVGTSGSGPRGQVTVHMTDTSYNGFDGKTFNSDGIGGVLICNQVDEGKRAVIRATGKFSGNNTGWKAKIGIRDGFVDQAFVGISDGTQYVYNSNSSPTGPADFVGDNSVIRDNNNDKTGQAFTIAITP